MNLKALLTEVTLAIENGEQAQETSDGERKKLQKRVFSL